MVPTQVITQGRYVGLAKEFDPKVSHNFIAKNVTDRGINIASISANGFSGYWVLELNVRLSIPDEEVFPLIEDHTPIKFKTTQSITEAEFSKFLSTAMWMLID